MYPIIIFAFNRPDSLKATVEFLKINPEALESDLFIYVDGARDNKRGEKEKVLEVREFCKSIKGFKSITCNFSDSNKGLGPSIISGVSEVINKYGAAIIIEDDLLVQPNFLKFINKGLEEYRSYNEIWSICGYTNKIKVPSNYEYDAYFCPRSSSWGWATWADRWNSVDWTFGKWEEWSKMRKDFNKWGGSDCFSMLEGCRDGKNKSWAIRFCFNQFLQNKLSLFPVKSLVRNEGFDGYGTNCKKYSRFKFELINPDKQDFIMPDSHQVIPSLKKQVLWYNSIPLRIWSKLMYLLYK